MEGVSYEAASLAGHLKLGNLIYLYDDNEITIDGSTDLAFTEDRTKRFAAAGWHVSVVKDGNDLKAIESAIREAQKVKDKPSLIRVKTIIGFGMPKAGTSKAHSDAPGADAVRETKRNLGWPENRSFYVPKEVAAHFKKAIKSGASLEKDWNERVKKYAKAHPTLAAEFCTSISGSLPDGWEKSLPSFDAVEAKATRAYSGDVINAIADAVPTASVISAFVTAALPSSFMSLATSLTVVTNSFSAAIVASIFGPAFLVALTRALACRVSLSGFACVFHPSFKNSTEISVAATYAA